MSGRQHDREEPRAAPGSLLRSGWRRSRVGCASGDLEREGKLVRKVQTTDPEYVLGRWRAAGECGDAHTAASCLAADVELISPLTERFRFRGRDQVRGLLSAAFTAIEEIRFHTQVGDGDTYALFYRGRIGTQNLEEAQLLRLDDQGHIRELTLFGRPLPALTGLISTLGPELARQEGRPALAAFLGAATAPLHAMARLGEHHIVPLAAPRS